MSSTEDDVLDVFEAGLGCVFEEPQFAVGSPGSIYSHEFDTSLVSRFPQLASKAHHSFKLIVPTPAQDASTPLMAHHIWQAAFALCRSTAAGTVNVKDLTVIELGAGVGLCGLVAGACGAQRVISTDYPDEGIIKALELNYEKVFGDGFRYAARGNSYDGIWWDVLGHAWGNKDSLNKIISRITSPVVIFMADLLWIPTAHMDLLSDVFALLSLDHGSAGGQSKAHIAAGLHTSRETIDAFFRKARESFGFTVKKIGEVKIGPMGLEDGLFHIAEEVSEERRSLERSDPTERKKWVLMYEMWL
ncbi:hypothetical protein BDR26DRAFT_849321 [Obelidium mucronatum]|nr:hypothetical protein BDR26DRAFT_849321 [Obelidium mucronatum]